jgi:acyl-[acyl-carrier-protein]-phospholipid O-acyltransferase/long-chain-fatty-acid--[acyl-carrier-protein] ligase
METRTTDDGGRTAENGNLTPDFRPPASGLRSFWLMFVVEFQNAFSDNLLKWLVIFLIAGMGLPEDERSRLVSIITALFALPFVLFSMTGGFLADRFSKRNVAVGVKCAEVGIMSLALLGLWWNNLPVLLCCIFLMSTHSSIFGPSKYGLLPELLPEKKLSWGNGIFSLGTFSAIIVGLTVAGWLRDAFGRRQIWSGAVLIALAGFGLVTTLGVKRVPAADPAKRFRVNFIGDFLSQMRAIRSDRILFLGAMGNAYLWFLGALLQPTILFYGQDILHLDDTHSGWLQAALILGIGVGSLVAGYLSAQKIEYGLIPLGMTGLTVFAALLARPGLTFHGVAWNLGLLGFSCGFFNVPVNAIIQHRPEAARKGIVIAASTLLSWIGILLASGIYYLLAVVLRLHSREIFMVGAALTLAGGIYAVILLPDALVRLALWMLTKTIYRIRIEGRDNIPEKGGALFVSNHVSFVDALLLMASTDRQIGFLMHRDFYELWWIKPFTKMLGLIPIASDLGPRELLQSLHTAGDVIRGGGVMCIFAEGKISQTGELDEFHRGYERIMKGVDAPIVPIALAGIWGSIFSFEGGKFFWKWPRKFPYRVTVRYGLPLPPTATPDEVRAAVGKLLTPDKHG